jgi:hypothetical protein
MSKLIDVIDRYIAMWNDTDAERRRALIARTWTETASYLDPVLQGESQAGIDAMIQGVQARFPGHRFRRTTDRRSSPAPISVWLPLTVACRPSPGFSTTPRPRGRHREAGRAALARP